MPILQWRHGKTAADVIRLMQQEMSKAGLADKVTWNQNNFAASVGWGTVLSIKGHVTDTEIVLEKCSGASGGAALAKIRELLLEAFPGGDNPIPK